MIMRCRLPFKLGYENEIYKNLTVAANKLNSFTVYKHEQIPDRFHIKNSKRRSNLLLVANVHYAFLDAIHLKGTYTLFFILNLND